MKVISENEFAGYRQECLEFATLRPGYEYFQGKGLAFHEGCDDLHHYMASFVRLPSERRIGIMARHRHPDLKHRVGLMALAGDPNPFVTLDEFLGCLGEDRSLVEWLSPWLAEKPRWVVLFEDLMGRSFVIENCWDPSLAENHKAYLEKKYPDRFYRIEEREPFVDPRGGG